MFTGQLTLGCILAIVAPDLPGAGSDARPPPGEPGAKPKHQLTFVRIKKLDRSSSPSSSRSQKPHRHRRPRPPAAPQPACADLSSRARRGNRGLRQAGGRVRWRYRESTTGRWQHLDLEPDELIRRFLQHVLPARFHRVRRFGWLHPAATTLALTCPRSRGEATVPRQRALTRTSPGTDVGNHAPSRLIRSQPPPSPQTLSAKRPSAAPVPGRPRLLPRHAGRGM